MEDRYQGCHGSSWNADHPDFRQVRDPAADDRVGAPSGASFLRSDVSIVHTGYAILSESKDLCEE